jgi:hypothetical protein
MCREKERRRQRAATKIGRAICLAVVPAWLAATPVPAHGRMPVSPRMNAQTAAQVLKPSEGVAERARRYGPLIARAAARSGVDGRLLWVIAYLESRFNPLAVSPKGARGMMQFMPATAARFGLKDPHDPAAAADAAAKYVSFLLNRYGSRPDFVLAAYNAGEGAVDRWGGVPRYRETLAYVRQGMRMLDLPFTHPASLAGVHANPASASASPGPSTRPDNRQPVRRSVYAARRPPQSDDLESRQKASGEEKTPPQPAGVKAEKYVSRPRRLSIYYGGSRGRG